MFGPGSGEEVLARAQLSDSVAPLVSSTLSGEALTASPRLINGVVALLSRYIDVRYFLYYVSQALNPAPQRG